MELLIIFLLCTVGAAAMIIDLLDKFPLCGIFGKLIVMNVFPHGFMLLWFLIFVHSLWKGLASVVLMCVIAGGLMLYCMLRIAVTATTRKGSTRKAQTRTRSITKAMLR